MRSLCTFFFKTDPIVLSFLLICLKKRKIYKWFKINRFKKKNSFLLKLTNN